jgi:hypothetical protein
MRQGGGVEQTYQRPEPIWANLGNHLSASANTVAGKYTAYGHKSVWENSAVYNRT